MAYHERDEALKREDEALRKEWLRIENSDLTAETKQRIEKFVKGDGALRNKLREAVNGPAEEMEQRVREIIPPVLCALFPDEVRKLLNDDIVVDPMAKKKLQGPIEARLRKIETARETLFQSMRAATAPRQ